MSRAVRLQKIVIAMLFSVSGAPRLKKLGMEGKSQEFQPQRTRRITKLSRSREVVSGARPISITFSSTFVPLRVLCGYFFFFAREVVSGFASGPLPRTLSNA